MRAKNVLLILSVFLFLMFTSVFAGEKISVKYIKTSDGDTARFLLDGENVRVRFLGINTPEVSGENKVEEPYGNEALAYTQKMLNDAKKFEIEYDEVAGEEDRFGRKLAYLWVDDELFEIKLLEQGLAKTYMLKNDYKYAKELRNAENKAKNAKIGVWSDEKPKDDVEETNKTPIDSYDNNLPDIYDSETSGEYDNSFSYVSFIIAGIIILLFFLYSKKKKKRMH